MPEKDRVTIELDRDLAISLFEWSYRFLTDQDPTFDHPADAVAIDQVSSELERTLAEPFQTEYPEILKAARARAEARYRERMGGEWLDDLSYRAASSG